MSRLPLGMRLHLLAGLNATGQESLIQMFSCVEPQKNLCFCTKDFRLADSSVTILVLSFLVLFSPTLKSLFMKITTA